MANAGESWVVTNWVTNSNLPDRLVGLASDISRQSPRLPSQTRARSPSPSVSSYTTRPPPSSIGSRSSYQPTVSSRASRAPSWVTTAPSARPRNQTLNEQLATTLVWTPADRVLWCEFHALLDCDIVFDFNEVGFNLWVDHHLDHLDGYRNLPQEVVCWFCDEFLFKASKPSAGERRENFERRMHHVYDDIREGCSQAQMRPDFGIVRWLHNRHQIDDDLFHHALGYTEVPKAYQFPVTVATYPVPDEQYLPEPPPSPAQRRHERPRDQTKYRIFH